MPEENQVSTTIGDDEVVQLRFSDDEGRVHDINAAEFAEVLQGLVEFTSDLAKGGAFGDGMPPVVRVRPPKEGSFVVEAILQWLGDNPEATTTLAMTASGTVVHALHLAARRLRGEPTDFDYLENGNVKVKWHGDKVDEVPRAVWEQLQTMKPRTRKSMRKIMAPLGDDVDRLEVTASTPPTESDPAGEIELVLERPDYLEAAREVDEIAESTDTFSVEASMSSIDFRPGEKWRVETSVGTRLATIEDSEFLLELDRGLALHKDDLFEVTIRENTIVKNGRTSKEWALISVARKRRGGDDGGNDSSAAPEASSEN